MAFEDWKPARFGVAVALIAVVGCGGRAMHPRLAQVPAREPTTEQDLVPVGSCDSWVDHERNRAREIALAWIDERRDTHKRNCKAGNPVAAGLGNGCRGDEDACYFSDDPRSGGGFMPNDGTSQRILPRAEQVSDTSSQVAGVHEAERVKSDHQQVYVLQEGALHIIQAWPPEQARVVSKTAMDGDPKHLFVAGDRAVVFSDLRAGAGLRRTRVSILDITDRASPRTLRELTLTGVYLAARRVGKTVHTVVAQRRFPVLALVGARLMPPKLCGSNIFASYERIRDEIIELIDSQPDSAWLPTVEIESEGINKTLVSCNQYRRAESDYEVDGVTTVVSFDLEGSTPSMVSLSDAAEVVFASERHLYTAVKVDPHVLPKVRTHPSTRYSMTAIHRFRLAEGAARYEGSSAVSGTLYDSLAMDEHADHLRVVSTDLRGNVVSVLSDRDGKWGISSWVGGIAPDEKVRAVRFVGDRGYVVTFREVDSLFAIDLNDGRVKVLGELKIPGDASYMHPLPQHRLLTVGFGSSDSEKPTALDAVRLQLVDVSVPASPKLEHVAILGKRASTSAVQNKHLAFNYFAPKKLLLLPIGVLRPQPDQPESYFRGIMAFAIDAGTGFKLIGQAPGPPNGGGFQRTIVMDDYVMMVSQGSLAIRKLSNLSQDVRTCPLR